MSEQSSNPIDALNSLIDGRLMDINTCIPGVIVGYSDGKARVLPTGKKMFSDGEKLDFPIIQNAKVVWPAFSGGLAGVKGPIKPGDKCLIVFSQQAIDGTDDRRMFDLQDAYAIMCDLGDVGRGDSENNDDMTMFFGDANIRITSGGAIVLNAPGGVTINTPETTNTGTFESYGLITYRNGMTGYGGGGVTMISGNINHVSGSITSGGKKIDGTHTHNETGTITLPPNP